MKTTSKEHGYVLIIDDDKDICHLLSFLLEHAGYETQQGYDGTTAMQLLAQREPDVLLLDSIIPEPNGMVVLAHAHTLYPQLPVVMITGNAGILSAVIFKAIGRTFVTQLVAVAVPADDSLLARI